MTTISGAKYAVGDLVGIRGSEKKAVILRTEDYTKVVEVSDAQKAGQARILAESSTGGMRSEPVEKPKPIEGHDLYVGDVSGLPLEAPRCISARPSR